MAISPDARYAAFISGAPNLVPYVSNWTRVSYWVDTWAGPDSIRMVSAVSPSDLVEEADGDSWNHSSSADGRYVVYTTEAGNVTPHFDMKGYADIVLHDIVTGESTLVTAEPYGSPATGDSAKGSVSANGRLVAFASHAIDPTDDLVPDGVYQIYLRDMQTGITRLVSINAEGEPADDNCSDVRISADGSRIVFVSWASNLTADDARDERQVYACDVSTGLIRMVSMSTVSGGANGSSLSLGIKSDGANCVFASDATDLIAGDINGSSDIFKVNIANGTTQRISVSDGTPGAEADGDSIDPVMSAGSQIVAFRSQATNLTADTVDGKWNVFVRDIPNDTTSLVSIADGSAVGADADCLSVSISSDGQFVAFTSMAANLVEGGASGTTDIFVRDLTLGSTIRLVENAVQPYITTGGQWLFYVAADGNVYRKEVDHSAF